MSGAEMSGTDTGAHISRTATRAVTRKAALALAASLAFSASAFAQDGGPPDPKEIEEKVIEIERLMRKAEDSLARSLDAKEPGAGAAAKMEKLLDEKARRETGRSADELRKEADGGSAEAGETLRKLLEETKSEAGAEASAEIEKLLDEKARAGTGKSAEELRKLADGGSSEASATIRKLLDEAMGESGASGASEGIRKILEETKSGGKGASQGIEWLLGQAQKGGTRSEGEPDPNQPKKDGEDQGPDRKPQKPEGGDKPQGGKDPKDPDKPKDPEPPESKKEKPRTPEFDQWYAALPPQVKKAYDSEDWDSIPPQFRTILRAWTKKMADERDRTK